MPCGTEWGAALTACALVIIGFLAMQLNDFRSPTQLNLYIGNGHSGRMQHVNRADDQPLLSIDVHISHRHPKPLSGGIPTLIHQTWKDKHVPEKFGHWPWSWKQHNPRWVYTLWTDDDNRRLVERHYPWFLPTYDSLKHPVMKSDAARLFYLHRYGGVYADLDFECLRNLDKLLDAHHGVVLAQMGHNTSFEHSLPYVGACSRVTQQETPTATPGWQARLDTTFGCTQRAWYVDVFFHGAVANARRHPSSSPSSPSSSSLPSQQIEQRAKLPMQVAEFTTGPVLLYDAVQLWQRNWANDVVYVADMQQSTADNTHSITVLPPEFVYPVDWVDRPAECIPGDEEWNTDACKAMYPDAFCITYWTHSWEYVEWEEHDAKHTDLSSVARQAQHQDRL